MGICDSCTRRKTSGVGQEPDHRNRVQYRSGGRAYLCVRSRRRRRHRALTETTKDIDMTTATTPQPKTISKTVARQDRHHDPRAGRRVRPRTRRAQGAGDRRPRRARRHLYPPDHQGAARSGGRWTRDAVRRHLPAVLAGGHCDARASRRSSTTWRSATTSCTASTTGRAIRRWRARTSNGTPHARPTSGVIRTTTCTTPTPTSSAWTAMWATASCG